MAERSGEWAIEELEIIGYADALTEDLVPRVVPPVYRPRSTPSVVLMPPFEVSGTVLSRATHITPAAFERAISDEQATRVASVLDAHPDHLLWIDEDMKPHYAPADQARETLTSIAKTRSDAAIRALQGGDLETAAGLAQTAVSADERCLNAVLAKAVLQRIQGNEERVSLLREVARKLDPHLGFDSWVDYCARQFRPSASRGKYRGIALERAAA